VDERTRVLVVDDELNLVELVSTALRYADFDTETARSAREALEKVRQFKPHLIILDVMLPDQDGFEVARALTATGVDVPILFLTAKDATEDKVRGLTVGGDDYVTKPFSLDELIARVRVILRRSGHRQESRNILTFADLEMDEDLREVRRGDHGIELTATEYRLLRYLLINARRVLTRAQILDHVWSYDFGGDAGILETYISYLRKKVDAVDPPLIHTVRGMGYVLRLPRG
jgi:two-component system OmpR family response regulator